MKVDVYIEGERLDLFDDESISVTQGVQDLKDISKLFADFSQTFSVPASRNNNRIFKQYYNADIDGGFDARTRKIGTIDVNTLDFKRGKIQLESVEIKDNKPSNYKITFFGDAIKIKDELGEDKLFDLDWLVNFNHDYTEAKVEEGLTTGIDFTVDGVSYPQGVIYPLISYFKQYLYNSDPSDTTDTPTLVNIAYDAGRTAGVRFDDLKPAIRLSIIVEAIGKKYGFNFTGSFFESENYKALYMPLNNSTTKLSNGVLEYENESGSNPPESSLSDDRLIYQTTVTPKAGFTTVPYRIKLTWNGTTVYESQSDLTGTQIKKGTIQTPTANYNVTATVITEEDFEFDATTNLEYRAVGNSVIVPIFTNSYLNQQIDLVSEILRQMYDIKVYDFLTSLFKMFNLVVVPDGTDLFIEDLQTWYASGQIYDITQYVDTSKLNIAKGKIFNQINYQFEESDQVLADEFNQSNRLVYGNLENKLYTDSTQTELLDGETLDIDVIFENPINERILDQDTNALTTVQYLPYFNREVKSIAGNPFLFFISQVSVVSNPIGFEGVGSYKELNGNIIMPSHSRAIDDDTTFACNFNAELSEYTYGVMSKNIFTEYYADYIGDMFSIKRRNYKLDSELPYWLLNKLKLNDRLIIGDRRYIINKLTSNLVKRKDSFELVNDIYSAPLASDILNSSKFVPSSVSYGNEAITDTTNYVGIANQTPVLVDTGDGTGWVTINSFGTSVINTINFSLLVNNTGATRSVQIQVNDGLNNPKFTITQSPNGVTVDATTVTVDNNIITSDNE